MSHPSPRQPLPIIHVGLGPWGQDWGSTVLPHNDLVRVVARVDADVTQAAVFNDDIPGFTSLAGALATTDAAAVLITAGIEAHHHLAHEALTAGKHVLLEKPFTVTLAEANSLVALAEQQRLALCVAQNYRFWPAAEAARAALAQDVIGEVVNARILFRRDHGAYAPSVAAPAGAPTGSILYQISVHHFDLVRALLGEVSQVTARHWPRACLPGRVTALSALLKLASGQVVEYSANQASTMPQTPWSGLWTIEGTCGQLRWAGGPEVDEQAFVEVTREGQRYAIELAAPTCSDRERVLGEFLDAVHGKTSQLAGSDNIATLRLVVAAAESLTEG